MIFDKYILSIITILEGADPAGIVYLLYGTQNEQENTQNNEIEGYIRIYMTVYTDQKYREKS